ncbi:acyl-CoA dehydrogenase family protein [Halobacillus karajensis]|uniref:Acyl-CoA dehydrogenase n=1 Tax=Halobacillus karajensis TaxID=195088 RepID=A0A024P4W7_9BACI|nr:acyl-CoA dehydrogenase family protein [Halobacillus karajensis]CDQ20712.1 putative acyl-CoA dehydrogenase [Halobacillus karajensis]CDQ23818.1 putative acyl-CoA dehydrogenase [Halobacillus karajensis]CDQ27296.1 putative acyl-CoA dehydrogenase [Halobacillus karajensis]
MEIRQGFLPFQNRRDFFTPEDFTNEEELMLKTTESFVKNHVQPQMEAIEQHQYSVAARLFKEAGDLGLLGVEVPEEYGGLSLSKKISGLIAEKMGHAGSFSVSFNIHAGVGTLPFIYFGTEKQKHKYLPKLASGRWIGAYALTEPDAGSDALNSKTRAIWDGEKGAWVLNGEKQWITNAHVADVYVVFAKTHHGMTAFIVEKSLPGISVGPEEKKMGIKGSSTATLVLEDVEIPSENVLGKVGNGHRIALNILNMARLKLAFSNIGTAKQALQLAGDYAKERLQFQSPLIEFTMIQEKIADMAIAIYGAESAAYRTADGLDQGMEGTAEVQDVSELIFTFAMECSINKVNCSEVLARVVDEAVQIHGGYGYMQEYEVERLYRDARISRIFEGTNEINRLTISKLFMKHYQNHKHREIENIESNQGQNGKWMQTSEQLLYLALKALTESGVEIEQEQEYSRLLSDMVSDLYVMESAFLRSEKSGQRGRLSMTHKGMTEVLCAERYRKIAEAVKTILSSVEASEKKRKDWFNALKGIEYPEFSGIFEKKRNIAKDVTGWDAAQAI